MTKTKTKTKTKVKVPKLSDVPSELIRQALGDLEKVEKSKKKYVVNMHDWFKIDDESLKCHVCLAGAVIAMAGNEEKEMVLKNDDYGRYAYHGLSPTDFRKDVRGKLNALDFFRCGDVVNGLDSMGIRKIPDFLSGSVYVPLYEGDKKGFKKRLREMADYLEKIGL